jgi:hypothetical protein
MSCLHKQNINFNFQQPAMFAFLGFHKNDINKCYLSFAALSAYKIPWSHIDSCKFCIYLRSSNVRHFEIVGAMRLKLRLQGHLPWHDLSTEFHVNIVTGSKVGGGNTQTDRQAHRQ